MKLDKPCILKQTKRRGRTARQILGLPPHGGQETGLYALHHCDNELCIEPTHLYVGTQADNVRDMMERGRHKHADNFGDNHPCSKLTSTQVEEIRERIANGETQSSVAKDYPVGRSQIANIISCGSWSRT